MGKTKLLIGACLTIGLVGQSHIAAQAASPLPAQIAAAGFYNCSKASAWMLSPTSWKNGPAVAGRLTVQATVGNKKMQVSMGKKGLGDSLLLPVGTYSKSAWRAAGCPSKGAVVWFDYVTSLFPAPAPAPKKICAWRNVPNPNFDPNAYTGYGLNMPYMKRYICK